MRPKQLHKYTMAHDNRRMLQVCRIDPLIEEEEVEQYLRSLPGFGKAIIYWSSTQPSSRCHIAFPTTITRDAAYDWLLSEADVIGARKVKVQKIYTADSPRITSFGRISYPFAPAVNFTRIPVRTPLSPLARVFSPADASVPALPPSPAPPESFSPTVAASATASPLENATTATKESVIACIKPPAGSFMAPRVTSPVFYTHASTQTDEDRSNEAHMDEKQLEKLVKDVMEELRINETNRVTGHEEEDLMWF
ncbi:hypothetical protein F5Y16DRAFT_393925 [Xylariaceae sp. FL0255]|nr:hypothetical protein F5Y16DRAFT_393925 [Xylariaceae sp. FL0255]